jgi:hypothetical protein
MKLHTQPLDMYYDDETGEVVMCFPQGPEDDDPNPVEFVAEKIVTIRIPNAVVSDREV